MLRATEIKNGKCSICRKSLPADKTGTMLKRATDNVGDTVVDDPQPRVGAPRTDPAAAPADGAFGFNLQEELQKPDDPNDDENKMRKLATLQEDSLLLEESKMYDGSPVDSGPRTAAPKTRGDSDLTDQDSALLPQSHAPARPKTSEPTIVDGESTVAPEAKPQPPVRKVMTAEEARTARENAAREAAAAAIHRDPGPKPGAPSSSSPGSPGSPPGSPGPENKTGPGNKAAEIRKTITQNWASVVTPETKPGMTLRGQTPEGKVKTGTTLITAGNRKTITSGSSIVVKTRTISEAGNAADMPDYELTEVLGEGGMGIVYLARQTSIDRTIAVKMLKPEMAKDAVLRDKFLTEAAVTGDLDHPNIVPIHDLGTSPTGSVFYAMKRVKGTPWSEVLAKQIAANELDDKLHSNLETLLRVSDAVAFAHSRCVLHRDLKPENVMLGSFGEVLVMDWGLALSITKDGKAEFVESAESMCGTPAYMAPEMATGPIAKIGVASDIYLLGAILFELITGVPPHFGDNTLNCLFAVGMNQITPTEKKGELVDIAMNAMATEPEERLQHFPSVRDFQSAVREYLSHSESITLSNRAAEDLERAHQTGKYDDYAQAVFAYKEAAAMWDKNVAAVDGRAIASLAYAEAAFAKDDLDLSASLLDRAIPDHELLWDQVESARQERLSRQRRLKLAMLMAQGLAGVVLIVMTVAFFMILNAHGKAVAAKDEADREKKKAVAAKDEADLQKKEAEQQRDLADKSKKEAEQQRDLAKVATAQAEEQKTIALSAKEAAVQAQSDAEYQAYVALIGLASANIADNGFGQARLQLQQTNAGLRNWEWGRLEFLCNKLYERAYAGPDGHKDRISQIAAYSTPAGPRLVTGSRDTKAKLWDVNDGKCLHTFEHGELIRAIDVNEAGNRLVTAGDGGLIKIWNLVDKSLVKEFTAHKRSAIFAVKFSPKGDNLLTGSEDRTAKLFDLDGQDLRTFSRHQDWVLSVAFNPLVPLFVTTSQDGSAILWNLEETNQYLEQVTTFKQHDGPVISCAFSPDGTKILTGGYDKTARVWSWSKTSVNFWESKEELVLTGHGGRVLTTEFSRDGKLIVTGSRDNTARVWQAADGQLVKTLRGHASAVTSAVILPDGHHVLTGSDDESAKLWDINLYEEFKVLRGHENEILSAHFSPDGSQVVTSSRDRTAKTWDTLTGQLLHTLTEGHEDQVQPVAVSSDGIHALSSGNDGTVRVWDLSRGLEQFRLTGHVGVVSAAVFSPDGRWIASAGDDHTVRLWDARTGQFVRRMGSDKVGHKHPVTSVAISPDNRFLVSADSNNRARVWDVATGNLVRVYDGHNGPIYAARFFPDSIHVATASLDHVVSIWDVTTGREIKVLTHPQGVTALDISADGKRIVTGEIAVGNMEPLVRLWDVATQKVLQVYKGHTKTLTWVAISPDGKKIASAAGPEKTYRIWNLATGAQEAVVPAHEYFCWAVAFTPDNRKLFTSGGYEVKLWELESHRQLFNIARHGAVSSAIFSPNGQYIFTGSWDKSVKRWETASGRRSWLQDQIDPRELLGFPQVHRDKVNGLGISLDGKMLLTVSDDRTAVIQDAETGEPLKVLQGHTRRVRDGNFSPDGKKVVTGSNDQTAKIWLVKSGACLLTLGGEGGHNGAILSTVFSPDGLYVLTGGEDSVSKLWDANTGKLLRTFQGHTAAVTSVAFAPLDPLTNRSDRIVSGSEDLTARIWDFMTGQEVLSLKGHTLELTAVAFSPDGRRVLTASKDRTAIIWPSQDWQPAAAVPTTPPTTSASLSLHPARRDE